MSTKKGGLLALIEEAARTSGPGGKCSVGLLLKQLDEADRADLEAAIAVESIPAAVIARTMRSLGHRCPDDSVMRHRRKACACEPR